MAIAGLKVVHAMPGRIRVKISRLKGNTALARQIQQRLPAVPGIQRVEVNLVTGSLLVLYNAAEMNPLDALMGLAETFTPLLPGLSMSDLEAWLTPSGNGSNAAPPFAEGLATFFGTLNTQVGKAAAGVDLKLLLPLTLFFFGIRGLLVAEKLSVPAWYDLLWFSFATFFMLHPRAVERHQ
jgi:heavy-metal-associated domain-containing protein